MSSRRPTSRADDGASRFRPGEIVAAKYVLLEPIGSGGMGEVWSARNLATDAEVALKLLSTRSSTPDGVARFQREAYATGRLAHRGIVRVYDLIDLPEASGSFAIVMERLRGRTLFERLRCEGPLSTDETLRYLLPILRALHYAHGMGIIHRDLKPENVFLHLEPDWQIIPKLLDFGVSKVLRHTGSALTAVGEIVGTPTYMSPEQFRGVNVDARSDVFSAGVLFYTCLTGRNPFSSESGMRVPFARAQEVRSERPPRITPALWAVIVRALAENPDDRFSTVAEALADAVVRAVPGATADLGARPSAPPMATNVTSPTSQSVTRRVQVVVRTRARKPLVAALLAACVAGVLFGSVGRHVAAADSAPAAAPSEVRDEPGSVPALPHPHRQDHRLREAEVVAK